MVPSPPGPPAYVPSSFPLAASASFNDIVNRQYLPPTALETPAEAPSLLLPPCRRHWRLNRCCNRGKGANEIPRACAPLFQPHGWAAMEVMGLHIHPNQETPSQEGFKKADIQLRLSTLLADRPPAGDKHAMSATRAEAPQ